MRTVTVRLIVDPHKKGMSIDEVRLAELVREFYRRHQGLLRPYQKAKVLANADDGAIWFVFCFLLLENSGNLDEPAPAEVIEVVDCVPAQRTKLGVEWFEALEACYEIYSSHWRMPGTGPRSQREIDVAAHNVERLLTGIQDFADSLPGGQASVVDIEGLQHLLHGGQLALNRHYHNVESDYDGQGYFLELALWHAHEFVLQVGNRLGFTRSA